MRMLEVFEKVLAQAMEKEPRAWLYEIQSVMKATDDGKVHPEDLYQIKVVFGMPLNHTLIYEVDSDEKMTEKIIDEPWLEDRPISHRIENGLEAAFERMMQANFAYDWIYPEVVLRHPLHPDIIEPAYYFGVRVRGKREYISVGLFSAEVKFAK